MRIFFLEFCGALLAFLVITQVILPLFFSSHFRFFWLFKAKKEEESQTTGDDLRDAVKEVVGLKKSTDKAIKKVQKRTKENLDAAEELNSKVEDLN